ncbi:MAG TPA: response regulator [Candidatus Hydrogenedentes bacterium]|jgi:DNA-binding response OmpR family regulator|nr:MAG: Transcriptional regulatory protein YycF [Candidatus Hydrogenedentes bacterium ADurb.Bin170]HNZ47336.1 response regulator [Candidatus Hydrogenedentota bacterium]HOD94095.1 response regulator [Candidatus Hydrogenedentota bacterium]HOH42560.1 response regulator [Candidatus Hydrogenedentota bacterium]HOM48181.1 response regulator [Candidatus Hydrogenedentota bacterium]
MSKILIVDDDVDLAELVRTKLTKEGHQAFAINTGDGAFEYAKQLKPDVILLDIMLPGQTGYQICRRIRKDPELYRSAVLMLTALGEEPEIVHGMEQGADDYLVKPFKLERLMDKITSLNALLASLGHVNRISNMMGTEAFKRELNHQLARDSAIACVYLDVVGFEAFCRSRSAELQEQALKSIAGLLTALIRSQGFYETAVAHMGRQHFVIMLKLEDYERFTGLLAQTFDEEVKQLYKPEELERGYITAMTRDGKEVQAPIMALAIGVAHNKFRVFKSAKKMFEVLAQVRQKAQPIDGTSTIFVDRRHTNR